MYTRNPSTVALVTDQIEPRLRNAPIADARVDSWTSVRLNRKARRAAASRARRSR